jgi:hypothetical protein
MPQVVFNHQLSDLHLVNEDSNVQGRVTMLKSVLSRIKSYQVCTLKRFYRQGLYGFFSTLYEILID